MQISGNNKKLNKFILHLQKKINQISISNFNKKLFIKTKNRKNLML